MQGHSHKTTGLALQNRRLVKVTRKGGGWHAELTEAGSAHLAGGTPEAPLAPTPVANRIDPLLTPQKTPPERTASYQELSVYLPQRWLFWASQGSRLPSHTEGPRRTGPMKARVLNPGCHLRGPSQSFGHPWT